MFGKEINLNLGCGKEISLNLGCGNDLRKNYLNLDKVEIDLENPLPFSNDSIKKIVLQNVVEYIINHKQLLKECYRILKNKGILNISTANYTSLFHRLKFGFGRDYAHVNFFSYKMFLEEVQEAGFKIEKIKGNSLTFLPAVFAGNIRVQARKKAGWD